MRVFEQDYIMRQIELMTQAFSKLFFHKDTGKIEMFEADGSLSGAGLLYHRLKALLNKGDLNGAEDLLFRELERSPIPEYFVVAVNFYKDLAALSDEQLQQGGFTRAEIQSGLQDVQALLAKYEQGE